jgi:hypothetical protein
MRRVHQVIFFFWRAVFFYSDMAVADPQGR